MKVVDLHCDTLGVLLEKKLQGEACDLYENTGHLDISRMQQQDYLLQCFAAFVCLERVDSAYERGRQLAELYREFCERYAAYIAPVRCFADIARNKEKGLISAMLTIEEGGVLEGSVKHLEEFYEMGVRMITLTWNYPNEIGYPGSLEKTPLPQVQDWNVTGEYPGLTKRGIEIVQCMEEKGIITDVSHLSDAGFWDVAAITKKPFIASHSNARSICGHKRNLSDAQIRTIAQRGGVIGLNYCDEFLEHDVTKLSMESFLRQVKHIIKVGGEQVLALGSDFDGIDTNPVLPHAGELSRLFEAMSQSGIPASVIDKVKGENALCMMREVLR